MSPATSVAATISANFGAVPSPRQSSSARQEIALRRQGGSARTVPDDEVGEPREHVEVVVADELDVDEPDAGVDDLRDVLAAGDEDRGEAVCNCAFMPSAPACRAPYRPAAAKSTISRGETPRCVLGDGGREG